MNGLMTKVLGSVFGVLLTLVGWMIKEQISEVSTSLRQIQKDVADLNRDSLLLKQRVDFKLEWMQREIAEMRLLIEAEKGKDGK